MAHSILFKLSLFSQLARLACAAPNVSTQSACDAIKKALPGKLSLPNEPAYNKENNDYYNIGLAELKPACIIHPTTALEVASIVKILNQYSDVKFAVKSGGHDPNAGHSSVKDGVLISLRKITGVQNDPAKKVAYVKPGGHWSDVIEPLDKQGVTVVGGRLGQVGIGGYLMQGGLSYLTAQYGMACDSIVEYETILANSTIANINMKNNKDLMVAMRGGGDQFGITTKFTLQTYPIGKIWGGYRVYTSSAGPALFAALHDFIGDQKDSKAAVIFTTSQQLGGYGMYGIFFLYDGPTPPPGVWGKFDAVKPSIDLAKTQTYSEMLGSAGMSLGGSSSSSSVAPATPSSTGFAALLGNLAGSSAPKAGSSVPKTGSPPTTSSGTGLGAALGTLGTAALSNFGDTLSNLIGPIGTRTSFRSITLPYISSNPNWYSEIEAEWKNLTSSYLSTHKSTIATIAFQPLPHLVGKQTAARGGNAMGLTANDHSRFVLETTALWQDKADDEVLAVIHRKLSEKITQQLVAMKSKFTTTEAAAVGEYNPYFMNDASSDQDVMGSYKDVDKFRRMQREVDPTGFWKRAGGFKYRD